MSTATASAEPRTVVSSIPPFGIEADHPRNSDLYIQSIPNCRLRSAIAGNKGMRDSKGVTRTPLDQARHLASFPPSPGMQLHVNPTDCTYIIIDPLYNNEEMCEQITRWLRENTPVRPDQKVRGVKPLEGELDRHRMKTLCREMIYLVQAGEAKKCKGAMPTLQEVDELVGHYLLNPGSRVQNTQPVYEKDWDDWVANLSRTGG